MLDIYNHAILNTTSVYQYTPHTIQMRAQWFKDKKAAGWPVFVADLAGVVVGFASYGAFRAWPGYKYSVEHKVYTHTDHRRQGIAKLLMVAIIEAAKAQELHTIIAGIDTNNEISIHLHSKLGFVEVAHFKQVGFKFGKWLDLKFMQLMLNTPLNPQDG
jgi:phosphinothricin acetyltransferase